VVFPELMITSCGNKSWKCQHSNRGMLHDDDDAGDIEMHL